MARTPADIFNARTVAIVGATDRSHWPRNIYANMKESGYDGKIFPVNPKRDEIWGVECYPDLASLPEPADLALLIVPAPAVEPALRLGAENGLKSAIVYAAGFGDGGKPDSIERGAKFKTFLATLDVAVIGPNCMGSVGVRQRLYLYPHTHVARLTPGPVALVTQSGGTLSYIVKSFTERGLNFSYAISSGNELDLDLADYVNFLVDDEATRQIILFIEGIRDPAAFMAAAGRAVPALPAAGGKKSDCAGAALEAALGRAGLAAPATARTVDGAQAAEAAAGIGFPVALKIVSPQASHKTEVGGVALGLDDEAAVEAAAAAMAQRLKAADPKARIEGYLVQEMVSGVEILAGARDDALYGPMIVLGAGGVMVELVRDVAIRLLPVTRGDVRAMLEELSVSELLHGFRGGAACDVPALVDAVVALGDFYLDHRDGLADLEINPLMVGPKGQGVRAVDIRAVARAG